MGALASSCLQLLTMGGIGRRRINAHSLQEATTGIANLVGVTGFYENQRPSLERLGGWPIKSEALQLLRERVDF